MKRLVPLLLLLTFGVGYIVVTQSMPEPDYKHPETPTSSVELLEAQTCIRIGSAEKDDIISRLSDRHAIDYSDGVWYIDGQEFGNAQYEDYSFVACSTPDIINLIEAAKTED